ncbi:hypothetical protein, partial [Botrimarina sp.]|uniref:hypothetical protein n=1 Tax=Botrimarina sp. TaxID=2795802 RepID=UPI0032EF9623
MVCAAVPALGGATAPSLARPMLVSANLAFLSGRRVEAAARLREALRRHLAALAAGYRLVDEG